MTFFEAYMLGIVLMGAPWVGPSTNPPPSRPVPVVQGNRDASVNWGLIGTYTSQIAGVRIAPPSTGDGGLR